MKQGWLIIWMFLILGVARAAPAEYPLLIKIEGPGGPAQDAFAAQAIVSLGDAVTLSESGSQLIVALGEAAFHRACQKNIPVVAVQVSDSVVSQWRSDGCNAVAVFSYVDPFVQFLLRKKIMPGAKRVGVLLSENSEHLLPSLQRYARQTNVALVVKHVNRDDTLSAALSDVLLRVDVLIAIPDKYIFNAENARLLIMVGYRQGKPIIGPDDHWVRAGSLASAYISSEALVHSVSFLIREYLRSGNIGKDRYASASVLVNENVADALSIDVQGEPTLMQNMLEQGAESLL